MRTIGGAAVREIDALVELLDSAGYGVGPLHVYLQHYEWPRGYAHARNICQNGQVAGSMSEYMSLAPVLRKYLDDIVPDNVYHAASASARKMCELIETLMLCQRPGAVTAARLEELVVQYLTAKQLAYGFTCWIPKDHYLLHLARVLDALGFLVNSLVLERRHKGIKRAVKDRLNTRNMERCMMEEVVVQQLRDLQVPLVKAGLVDAARPSDAVLQGLSQAMMDPNLVEDDVFVSKVCSVNSRSVYARDVVIYNVDSDTVSVGEVWYHAEVRGTTFTCVSRWEFISRDDYAVNVVVRDDPKLIQSSRLLESAVRSAASTAEISHVIIPVLLRDLAFA